MSITVQDALAGGFIICRKPHHPNPWHVEQYLQVRSLNVKTRILDFTAETEFEQTFYNPNYHRLEGEFLFPVPKGIQIEQFTMWINGKETEAELLDARKAREIYEEIVRSMKDPALLEFADHDLLKMRIFPIEPNSEQKVRIIYRESLAKDEQTLEYVFPFQFDEQKVGPLGDFTMDITLKSSNEIKNIYSPSHELDISRRGRAEARLSLEERNFDASSDLRLYFTQSTDKVGISQLFHKPINDDGYFMVQLSPGFVDDQSQIASKDITFVVDASGSMNGEKMEQAKRAVKFCLTNLDPRDHFNVIRFSTEAHSLFDVRKPALHGNLDKALKFVDGWKAIGGTNIEDALKLALETEGKNDNHMIVFLTDGKPTIGTTDHQQLLDQIKKGNTSQSRIFTFGIGTEINTHLLDRITEQTRAYRTYVLPDEDLELKLSSFYTKVSSPVLSDLKINWGRNVYDVYPKELPDLFKGSSLTIFGRYKSTGTEEIELGGKLGQTSKRFTYNLDFDKENENTFVSSLWATRKVAYLIDQVRLNGESKELKDEIKDLALEHGIITPYTSYLIIEDERDLVRRPVPPRPPIIPMPEPIFFEESRNINEIISIDAGEGSIRNSRGTAQMKSADNAAANKSAIREQKIAFEKDGILHMELTNKRVQGRNFYQNGSQWNDAFIDKAKWTKEKKIDFASKEYFELIENNADIGEILALGRNVQFVYENVLYNIVN